MAKIPERAFLVVAMGAIIASSPASAAPKVSESVSYYNVSGKTPQEVRTSLNQNGPTDKSGKRFDAVTNWYVNWNYNFNKTAKNCAIATASLNVKVEIKMPRLTTDNATLRQSFDTYTAKLMVHEKGHGKIGVDIASRIETEMAKLPAEATCDAMAKAGNKLGQDLVKVANQQDIAYDASTKHGATQGAVFP